MDTWTVNSCEVLFRFECWLLHTGLLLWVWWCILLVRNSILIIAHFLGKWAYWSCKDSKTISRWERCDASDILSQSRSFPIWIHSCTVKYIQIAAHLTPHYNNKQERPFRVLHLFETMKQHEGSIHSNTWLDLLGMVHHPRRHKKCVQYEYKSIVLM